MRFFKQLNRFLKVSGFECRSRIKIICVEGSGIQFDGLLEFGRGVFEASLDCKCLADGNVGFGQIRIEFQRVSAGTLRLLQIARITPPSIKIDISLSQPRPGQSKLRIYRNRSREHLPRKPHVLTSPRLEKLAPAQIKFIRLNIRRGWLEQTTFLPLREGKSQRIKNATGNLILNGEDVVDL